MKEVRLSINKKNVYEEVAKTTSYTGSKIKDDENGYERIFTTDEDRLMLERFWRESCNSATERLKPFIVSVSEQPESQTLELERNYEVELELSTSFDEVLTDSIQTSLFSFFVSMIVSKWYKFTNKDETESYTREAVGMLEDVMSKVYFKKKPKRVKPMMG